MSFYNLLITANMMDTDREDQNGPVYGHPAMERGIATHIFPEHSTPSSVAHQLIKDELSLDGNPKMNVRLVYV